MKGTNKLSVPVTGNLFFSIVSFSGPFQRFNRNFSDEHPDTFLPGGSGYLTNICKGRLRPEIQPYILLTEKVPFSNIFHWKMVPLK